ADVPLVTHLGPGPSGAPTDLIVSDAGQHQVLRVWREDDQWKEAVLAEVQVPVHTQVIDLDGDGRLDILVAELGELPPSERRVGKVLMLRGLASGGFERRTILEDLGRVTDVRAVDLDGDGDLDLAVAVCGGGSSGDGRWPEERGGGEGMRRTLASMDGGVDREWVGPDGRG